MRRDVVLIGEHQSAWVGTAANRFQESAAAGTRAAPGGEENHSPSDDDPALRVVGVNNCAGFGIQSSPKAERFLEYDRAASGRARD